MTRAAKSYDVLFIEEPLREPAATHHFRSSYPSDGITVLTPVLQEGLSPEAEAAAIRSLLDTTLAMRPAARTISWYYSPMALSFSSHLTPDLCIYDCMDELSAFRGAPKALTVMESWLFSRAQLVFTGGHSLYEAKKTGTMMFMLFPAVSIASLQKGGSIGTPDRTGRPAFDSASAHWFFWRDR